MAEYLGFLFIMALQLNKEVKLLMNFSGSLHVADVKEWLRVHESELDFKLGAKETPRRNQWTPTGEDRRASFSWTPSIPSSSFCRSP